MVIVAILDAILVWLVFAKLKPVRWNWLSGTVTVVTGAAILGTFLALLNHLGMPGKATVFAGDAGVIGTIAGPFSGSVRTRRTRNVGADRMPTDGKQRARRQRTRTEWRLT